MVQFESPLWRGFVDRIVKETCEALGVNYAASQPRCYLHKLLLYETGSHFLPHVDTEKADGMFATIVVILPSKYTGGEAHVSHGASSIVYDNCETSSWQTTVISWYTDVTHEIKSVTSGYRLALAYNLIHTTMSLRPAISNNILFLAKLRLVLWQWKQDAKGEYGPQKILYLLEHKYSQANLRASALKGKDAEKVALLNDLAKEVGFRLGLASVMCHLTGYPNGGYEYGGDDGFAEVTERDTTVVNFVDLDGNIVTKSLDFLRDEETIPEDLAEDAESGEPDDEDNDYMGNEAGSLERWYLRTVLVIWPDRNDLDIRFGGANFESTCRRISSSASECPSEEELKLANYLLSYSNQGPCLVASTLCNAAQRWKDHSLWMRAIQTCSQDVGFTVTTENDLYAAILELGFEEMKTTLDTLLHNDPQNERRFQFLDELCTWVAQQTAELQVVAYPWIEEQRSKVLNSLKKPSSHEQQLLLSLAYARGGIVCLKESIVPQITKDADPAFLRELAWQVYIDSRFAPSDSKQDVVFELLTSAISRTNFAKPKVSQYNRGSRKELVANPNYSEAKELLLKCFDANCESAAILVIERVWNAPGLPPQATRERAKEVLLPVLGFIQDHLRAHPTSIVPPLDEFSRKAIELYLDSVPFNSQAITKEDVHNIVQAILLMSDAEFFSHVLPRVESFPFPADNQKDLMEELHINLNRIGLPNNYTGPSLETIIMNMANTFAANTSLSNPKSIRVALESCLRCQASDACTIITKRILEVPVPDAAAIKRVLMPLVPKLKVLATRYNAVDRFAPTFQNILLVYIEKVLGPKPAEGPSKFLSGIRGWQCNCDSCKMVRKFLTDQPNRMVELDVIGAGPRKHLENYLQQYAKNAVSFETINTSPQGLKITKLDSIYESIRWKVEQTAGAKALKSLSSSDAELVRILGDNYARIIHALRDNSNQPPVPMRTLPAASSRSRTASSSATSSARKSGPPAAKKRKVATDTSEVIDLT